MCRNAWPTVEPLRFARFTPRWTAPVFFSGPRFDPSLAIWQDRRNGPALIRAVGRAAAGRRAGDIEHDTERAGTFEPLRFVARGRIAGPGLITTKTGRLETVGELARRSLDVMRETADGVWR